MPQIPKNTLLGYVKSKWKPVVQQVADWMDSYWHKEEMIPISKIEGLQPILNSYPTQAVISTLLSMLGPGILSISANESFVIPAGKILDLLRIDSGADQSLHFSDNASGEDLVGDQVDVAANVIRTVGVNIPAGNADRIVNVTGVTSALTLKYYIR